MRGERFLTDGMLGKLTRWLRMLGQDVEYSEGSDDEHLITAAKAEKRILLTRDVKLHQLAQKRGADAFLVEGAAKTEKLARLAERFGFRLEIDIAVSRCPKCNTRIRGVSKEEVLDRIPEATSSYYDEFWVCLGCGQIYWRGSHWKKIEKTLKEAKQALKDKPATGKLRRRP